MTDDDYIVLEEDSQSALQKAVNEYMDKGYRPIGGVAVVYFETAMAYKTRYIQALLLVV